MLTIIKKIFLSLNSLMVSLSRKMSRKGLYSFLEKEISQIKAEQKILNVGAGGPIQEILINSLKEKDNISFQSFDIDTKRNPDITGDICTYSWKEQEIYDYVILAEVLEHLNNPHQALENVYKLLKKGGKLIITVPFIFPIHLEPYDYYRYTRYGLEYLLRDFSNVVIKEKNSWAESILVLFSRIILGKKISQKILGFFCLMFSYMFLPLFILLGKIIPVTLMTTGYFVTALKE